MTPYEKLKEHLAEHKYKRGAHTGDAPADSSRRWRNHVRVREDNGDMVVTMFETNILRVSPDNIITLSLGRWDGSTTRQNLNDTLRTFVNWSFGVCKLRYKGHSQTVAYAAGKHYRFYNGMQFNVRGELLSPARSFSRKCVNKENTAEFRKAIENSGFKAIWPILFAVEPEPRSRLWSRVPITTAVTSASYTEEWPSIAAGYRRDFTDHKRAYKSLVRACTVNMVKIVDDGVTVV
jgi:hypothetical protein